MIIGCMSNTKLLFFQIIVTGILGAFILPKLLLDLTLLIQGKPETHIEQQIRSFGEKSLEKGIMAAFTETKTESYDIIAQYFKVYIALALILIILSLAIVYTTGSVIPLVLVGQLLLLIIQSLRLAGLEKALLVIQVLAFTGVVISLIAYKYYSRPIATENAFNQR